MKRKRKKKRLVKFTKKGDDANNKSMKDLFSFFTNTHRSRSMAREKKIENSSSIRNLLKRKNK